MSEWVVRVDVDTRVPLDEEVLVALSKTAEAHNGSVSNRAEGPGYTVTVDVEADGPLAAANDIARFALTELGADLRAQLVDHEGHHTGAVRSRGVAPGLPSTGLCG
jgi:hypothetical protein